MTPNRFRVVLVAFLFGSIPVAAFGDDVSPPSKMSVDSAAELRAAIDILKNHHMFREKADWSAIEARAFTMAAGAKTAADTYPAIAYALHQMGEHHSHLLPAMVVKALHENKPGTGETTLPKAGQYPGGIVAINMPGHTGSAESDRAYVAELRRILDKARKLGHCRIAIDLRWNDGGNMWPMLNGVASLLGKSPYGYFLNSGAPQEPWNLSSGWMSLSDEGIALISPDLARAQSNIPVAVLMSRHTVSSGEFTAIAFEGRPHTRLFGEPTGGFVTVNSQYELPDGAEMFISTGWAEDRLHRPYRVAVVPDDETALGQPTFDAAVKWLKSQPCRRAK